MRVEQAVFEPIESDLLPELTIRVRITGEDFEQRAIPIVAEVGDQTVNLIVPLLDGSGIQGFLIDTPEADAELRVGYADGPLIDTGITYDSAVS